MSRSRDPLIRRLEFVVARVDIRFDKKSPATSFSSRVCAIRVLWLFVRSCTVRPQNRELPNRLEVFGTVA